uniref:Hypothetical chloroplast RF1 n=1 Tax=Camoensia scandens TaxID=1231540 RepID=A0A8E7ITN4_9FABA|nr:hypothetical chloroplast RF1 [Camoensia scandens]
MIFQSFILDYLVSLCMKIMNSVVVVGLYYGFLTTLSIGPSYLFLLRARVMEEGTEKKVSATTGFITGQLMMFISIYYAPLHLALGRPYTITVIALPYLLFHFYLFSNNHKPFLNYGYKNQNSIRDFSTQRIFFNNLIFQLLNPFVFPSSLLVRLVNIYMFRCNNKLLFLTSSFVGWLIGHIFLMKWIGLILVWIQQNNSKKSNVLIKLNNVLIRFKSYKYIKYIISEFLNSEIMYEIIYLTSQSQIFVVLLFITCLYYLGRTPSTFFTKEFSEIREIKRNQIDKKRKIDVERTSKTAGTKQEQKISPEEYFSPFLFPKKEKKKDIFFGLQKPLVTILFDYKRWNRPLRYIKIDKFGVENAVRNEISQFFFHTCQSDGKERISFTYPPNLSTFRKIMQTKISLFTTEKISYDDELSNYWSSLNEEKKKKLSNEFINRAKVMDKGFIPLDIFEKRIRLCNDETKTKNLPKIYDPFLNGPCRGRIKKGFSPPIKNETYKKNNIWINKIHGILLNINSNSPEFEQKIDIIDIFDRKLLLTEISFFLNLINKSSIESISSLNLEALYLLFREHKQVKIDFEQQKKRKIEFLLDTIRTDLNDKTIINRKKCIGIKEISKKVPRWSYKLKDELEEMWNNRELGNYGIRSRKARRLVLFTSADSDPPIVDTNNTRKIKGRQKESAIIDYSQQPDFRRDIIMGSMRAQRRKIVPWKPFQGSARSPLFVDKMNEFLEILDLFNSIIESIIEDYKIFSLFKNLMWKKTESQSSDYTEKKTETKESEKEVEDKFRIIEEMEEKFRSGDQQFEDRKRFKKLEEEEVGRIETTETWDDVLFGQAIRSFLLLTQLILRKYILFPSLIITKNIVRILLFESPEWSEDFRDWNREIYINCNYDGIPFSEREFPKDWLTEGMQIKILLPFCVKPSHRSKSKVRYSRGFCSCFLTIFGGEVESPFTNYLLDGSRISFLDIIFKEFFDIIFQQLKIKMKKLKKKKYLFIVLKVLNERTKSFLSVSKDTAKSIIKSILKSTPINSSFLFRFINELSESKKDSTISNNNTMIYESPIPIQSININRTNSSLTEKIRDLNAKTKTIRKQIEKLTNEGGFITSEINISSNKTTYDAKRLELEKNIWQILQRRSARLARKSHSFFKVFMERVYIDIFLCIISILRNNVQPFLESTITKTKKKIKKSIYNNEAKTERTDEKNQSLIHFIKIIKKNSYNIRNTNSQNDVSSLSQAYVFYKLSQTQVINLYKLRSVFEYHRRSSLFLKNEIKDSFVGVHRIFHSKLRHKNPPDCVMNQWTNWLKGHSQYDLSHSRWSRLVPQKWRNRINERRVAEDLTKCDSYEKNQLILYKKEQVNVNLLKKKNKIKKQYEYDLLSYKSINYVNYYVNYADKKDSHIYHIYGYRSPFQANKKQVISYNYNTRKQKLFDITGDISITNYIAESDMIDMEKNLDRKYFDWMGMNVEILNRSISNPEFLFFSKLVIFYNAYTSNPWIIPTKSLFFNKFSENKNITGQVDLESSLSNQEKDIEEDFAGSGRTKDKGIRHKNEVELSYLLKNYLREAELDLVVRKYLSFQFNWKKPVLDYKIMDNINIYCLLLKLRDIKDVGIAFIQRGELDLGIMMIPNDKDLTLSLTKELLIIEPVRLSRKNDEQFFMYQTIGPSLIHKSKRQFYQRYPENKEKNDYDLLVPEDILSARRRRELRVLICFNPRNRNNVHRKTTFYNENKVHNCCQVLAKNKDLDREKKLMNLKLFLWPNYRLEDLACMNRYWFDTNNGSRFSILRIHMYPRLKIR